VRRALTILVLLAAIGLVSSVGVAWAGATMMRLGSPNNLLTNTWFNEPSVEYGEFNQWRVVQWTDATLTRRWGQGARPEWFEDPWIAHLRQAWHSWSEDGGGLTIAGVPPFSRVHGSPPVEPPLFAVFSDGLPKFEEREAGWPTRCLRCSWETGDERLDTPGERIRGGLFASHWTLPWGGWHGSYSSAGFSVEYEVALPLTPMWAGLAINATFWAAIWFVAFQVVPLPIWLWRRKRWKKRERRGLCARCGYELDIADDPVTTCPECALIMGRGPRGAWVGLRRQAIVTLMALVAVLGGFAMTRAVTADRLPPLHQAAADGNTELARALVAEGIPVNAQAPDLWSLNTSPLQNARPIAWASVRGHADAVEELLRAGADPDPVGDEQSPLALAIATGQAAVVDRLLAADASAAAAGRYTIAPIAVAVWSQDVELVERLFAHSSDRSEAPVSLELFQIVLVGRPAELKQLVLDRTVATRKDLENQAVFAFRFMDWDFVDTLIARGFDLKPASSRFLAYLEDAEDPLRALEALVGWGVDPTAVDRLSQTPLHIASRRPGSDAVLRRLAELGNPLDAANRNGRTALHLAALDGNDGNVRTLLDLGADATLRDHKGDTARELWWHARRGTDGYGEIRELLEAAESR
jgi:ankyrin repeat protein/DNA-directed RNA polymerase subunit RPC12/RpoP